LVGRHFDHLSGIIWVLDFDWLAWLPSIRHYKSGWSNVLWLILGFLKTVLRLRFLRCCLFGLDGEEGRKSLVIAGNLIVIEFTYFLMDLSIFNEGLIPALVAFLRSFDVIIIWVSETFD
jgi:hypothetical protein